MHSDTKKDERKRWHWHDICSIAMRLTQQGWSAKALECYWFGELGSQPSHFMKGEREIVLVGRHLVTVKHQLLGNSSYLLSVIRLTSQSQIKKKIKKYASYQQTQTLKYDWYACML